MRQATMGVLAVVLAICLLSSTSRGADPAEVQWREGLEGAWKSMKAEQRPLLLFMTTNGCLYCNKMKAHTYADEKVVDRVNASFIATSVNAADQPELAKRLGVRVYPTTVIISPQARVLESIDGYVTPIRFQHRIEAAMRRFETARRNSAEVK